MTGTAVATREPKAQLVTGGDVAAIVPRNIEEVFRLAGAIASSGMAPNTLNTPEKVTIAILAGAELGLPPFQAIQSFAVVNTRPTLWGDGLIAVVRSNGFKVKEWLEGDGDNMVAHCEVTRPDTAEVIERSYSVADAKKAGLWNKAGPWQTTPKRMLQMRARGFACRDGAADVLRGFQLREEVEDYTPIREERVIAQTTGTGMRARLEARSSVGGFDPDHVSRELDETLNGDTIPDHDPDTGEIVDADHEEAPQTAEIVDEAQTPDDTETATGGAPEPAGELFSADEPEPEPFDYLTWASETHGRLEKFTTLAELNAYTDSEENRANYAVLERESPAMAKQLSAAITGRRKALKDRERQG